MAWLRLIRLIWLFGVLPPGFEGERRILTDRIADLGDFTKALGLDETDKPLKTPPMTGVGWCPLVGRWSIAWRFFRA